MIKDLDGFIADMIAFMGQWKIKSFVTVDPGWNTSCAYWSIASLREITNYKIPLPDIQYFSVPKLLTKEEKLISAWEQFEIAKNYYLDRWGDTNWWYIEDAEFWIENNTSQKSAFGKGSLKSEVSGSRGDLLTLSKLIGGYANIVKPNFNLIPAQQWKGQMSKAATTIRVQREIGFTSNNDHIIDSIGMGLSFINNWRVTK